MPHEKCSAVMNLERNDYAYALHRSWRLTVGNICFQGYHQSLYTQSGRLGCCSPAVLSHRGAGQKCVCVCVCIFVSVSVCASIDDQHQFMSTAFGSYLSHLARDSHRRMKKGPKRGVVLCQGLVS